MIISKCDRLFGPLFRVQPKHYQKLSHGKVKVISVQLFKGLNLQYNIMVKIRTPNIKQNEIRSQRQSLFYRIETKSVAHVCLSDYCSSKSK